MPSQFPTLPTYAQQREDFLISARALGASLTSYPHPRRGPFGETLATDVALLGAPEAKRVLLALSGTHGIEGYYGSDCQTAWLRQLQDRPLPPDTAVLFVHLINPWGTAWMRRVNEDNIDLNRNYLDFSQRLPDNARYEPLHSIYTCKQLDGPARAAADASLAARVAQDGWSSVMAIVEAGQHAHADGLFYSGVEPSWSNQTLRQIIKDHLSCAETIIGFDLHTGAGAYGHPMLLTIAEAAYPALAELQRLYGPWLYTLLTGAGQLSDTGIAATATGYTSQALLDALPGTRLMQCVIECGTYPGEHVHKVLRDDQWLHLYGDPLDATGRRIKLDLLEQFYPADPQWRALTWLRTQQIWNQALAHLSQPITPAAD